METTGNDIVTRNPGQRWAVCLQTSEVDSLTGLRLADGAEICARPDEIWVRGTTLDETLGRQLRRHAHARRFWVLPDNQLVSPGQLVPHGYLPEGPWLPLRESVPVGLPDARCVVAPASKVNLRFVRSLDLVDPGLLLTDIHRWEVYVQSAPQVRLDRWSFAAAADGRVVVRGRPLPSITGSRYVTSQGICVPAGWTWSPCIDANILRGMFGLEGEDLAVWHAEDECDIIRDEQFVRASRLAVRITARELRHD